MATSSPTSSPEVAEEDSIPAFTVVKGGVVLKNIFLNAPPPEMRGSEEEEDDEDQPMLIGRHPDCHIVVDHPSVSRFHLEVRLRRRQRRLTVTDLSSVHGTRVSGRRIPPNTPVELAAGDTLHLGASRREYLLHWLSLREAFKLWDAVPPLHEEDKEEARTQEEANQQFVSDQRESLDMEIHQETGQQVVAKENELLAKEISSAPPLPEFAHFFLEESSISQFDDSKGVIKEELDDTNSKFSTLPPVPEPVGSSLAQEVKNTPIDVPASLINAERAVQSDRQGTSSILSQRSKLKSVSFLHVHTGRSKERSNVLSYDAYQEGAQNENAVITDNCNKESTMCRIMFDNFDGKETEEKEGIIALEMNNTIAHASGDIIMKNSQEGLKSSTSRELMQYTFPLSLEDDTFSDKENSTRNIAKETEPTEFISENRITQVSLDAKLQKRQKELADSISPVDFEDNFLGMDNSLLGVFVDMELTEPTPGNHNMQDAIDGNMKSHKDMKHDAVSPLNLDGSLFSDKENVAQNENSVDSEDHKNESAFCRVLFDYLDLTEVEEIEETTPLEKEKTTPYLSGIKVMERNQETLKPTISKELMDPISPLTFEHDPHSNNGSFMLNIAKEAKSNEFISENPSTEVSLDVKLQKNQREFMPISPLDFEDDIFADKENLNIVKLAKSNEFVPENPCTRVSVDAKLQKSQFMPISPLGFRDDIFSDKENLVLDVVMDKELKESISDNHIMQDAINGNMNSWNDMNYDAMSPQNWDGGLFSDKENVTPLSRELKPNNRRVLCSREDNKMSGYYTSNKRSQKGEQHKISAKSKCFDTLDEAFYSDKENLTPVSSAGMKVRRHLPHNIVMIADQDQDVFYSDEENLTPVPSAARKPRDMSESRARIEREITKKRVDRVPFQTLLANSPLRHTSSSNCDQVDAKVADFAAADLAIRLEDKLKNLSCKNHVSDRVGEGKKVWTMVTDADCLLDDESRKSIMLLRGIKGTRLIIPRIVIRELDCLKRREGLFRRPSKATSILQWIEECLEKESWWMHVQSSSEMLPVAPTPPATPTTQCNDEEMKLATGTFNPMAFFSPRSFTDIVSPTIGDQILNCALLFKKLRNREKIIILSNSVTLKIKAMAEGLLCEEPTEFHESLMNPCSNRFMWASSMPRGSAWSCLDNITLTENYYNSHHAVRRIPTAVETAKGLKLILLHNSLYGRQQTPSSKRR